MKSIIAVSLLALSLSGCSGVNTGQFSPVEKFTEENRQISENNTARLIAYANGMATCGDNAACQVGVSMAFAGNLGQQQLFKPQTWLEYLQLLLPYGDRIIDRLYSGGSGGQGIVVNRSDNVTFVGVANKNKAEQGAVLTTSADPYMPSMNINQDTTSASGPIYGTSPPAETVVVQPEVVLVPAP